MICFQNSTGLRGPEAEEKLEQYKKTDMVKNMSLVGPEGETLDLDGSVVGKEKVMRENPRKRKGIGETIDKTSKQQKLDSDKEKQENFTKLEKVWDDLSKSPKGKKENNCKERYSSSSSCSSSTSLLQCSCVCCNACRNTSTSSSEEDKTTLSTDSSRTVCDTTSVASDAEALDLAALLTVTDVEALAELFTATDVEEEQEEDDEYLSLQLFSFFPFGDLLKSSYTFSSFVKFSCFSLSESILCPMRGHDL
jgi:hypothetical protein